MAFDAHKNFAITTVLTAPSPATSGVSLTTASGGGAKLPTAPFNATVWPIGVEPIASNAEIVRVTVKATDTLTISRAQEGTTARTIVAGDQIAATVTARTLTDVESGITTLEAAVAGKQDASTAATDTDVATAVAAEAALRVAADNLKQDVSPPNAAFIPSDWETGGFNGNGVQVAVNGTYIYWATATTGFIGRANLDGSGINKTWLSGGVGAGGVAVNATHVYWTNFGGDVVGAGFIGRANLDGTGANSSFITGLTKPTEIVVDAAHLYWTNLGAAIGRANLDGTGVAATFITGLPGETYGIAVDATHIYWGGYTSNAVGRANLNGTGANATFISPCDQPAGVAVNATHIYWGNFGADGEGNGSVGRANLDGTNPIQNFVDSPLLGLPVSDVSGLALDAKFIYWQDHYNWRTGRASITEAPLLDARLTVLQRPDIYELTVGPNVAVTAVGAEPVAFAVGAHVVLAGYVTVSAPFDPVGDKLLSMPAEITPARRFMGYGSGALMVTSGSEFVSVYPYADGSAADGFYIQTLPGGWDGVTFPITLSLGSLVYARETP